jgi:hypothetical protein
MAVELEASASFGVAIGDKLDALHKVLSKEDPHPVYLPLSRGGIIPATGVAEVYLDFGKPPSNKIWNILSFVVFGPDDHTAVAASFAAWYVGDPGNPSLMGLRQPGFPLPGVVTYSRDIEWAMPSENVFTHIIAAAGTPVGANLLVAEWNLKDKW